jgi:hypothetical protein
MPDARPERYLWENFEPRKGDDLAFVACATHPNKERARGLVDRLYARHQRLTGDSHFADQLRRDFFGRAWAMVVVRGRQAGASATRRQPLRALTRAPGQAQ